MEGGSTPETMGMIPRAVEQVFKVVEDLKSKGWVYKMEGQFLEIVSASQSTNVPTFLNVSLQYNETVNDLLGKGEFDKKKHEIKHEKGQTRVTDVVVGAFIVHSTIPRSPLTAHYSSSPFANASPFSPRHCTITAYRRCHPHERTFFTFSLCLHPSNFWH